MYLILNRLAIVLIAITFIITLFFPLYFKMKVEESNEENKKSTNPIVESLDIESEIKRNEELLSIGKYYEVRKNVALLIDSIDEVEKTQLYHLLGWTYILEGKDKPVVARTPFYNLAYSFFSRISFNEKKYKKEKEILSSIYFAQAQELLKLQAYDQISFYLMVLKTWDQKRMIASLFDDLERSLRNQTHDIKIEQIKGIQSILNEYQPKGEIRGVLAAYMKEQAAKKFNQELVEESYLYWQMASLLNENPQLLKIEYLKLVQKQIVNILINQQHDLKIVAPYLKIWESIEKDATQKNQFITNLITLSEKLLRDNQHQRAIQTLVIANNLSSEEKKIDDRIQLIMKQVFQDAVYRSNTTLLNEVIKGMELLHMENIKEMEILTKKTFLKEAQENVKQHEYTDALSKAEWVLTVDSKNSEALNIAIQATYGLSDYWKCLEYIKKKEGKIDNLDEIIAVCEYLSGDDIKGEKLIEDLRKVNQLTNELKLRLAIGKFLLGDPSSAKQWLDEMPSSLEKQIVTIAINLEEEQWGALIETINMLPEDLQKSPVIQSILLVAEAKRGNQKAVEKQISKLNNQLGSNSTFNFAYPLRTIWEAKLGKYDPNYALALYYYRATKDPLVAITYLNVLVEPSIDAMILKGSILTDLNEYEESLELYNEMLQRNQEKSNFKHIQEILIGLATLFTKIEYYPDAVNTYRQMRLTIPESNENLSDEAYALQQVKRDDLALEKYKKLIEMNRLSSTDQIRMLRTLINLGQFDQVDTIVKNMLSDKIKLSLLEKLQLMRLMVVTENMSLINIISEEVEKEKELDTEQLEELLSFYLDNANYDSFWNIAKKNETLLNMSSKGLMLLAHYHLGLSHYSQAIKYAQEALTLNPWDSSAKQFIRNYSTDMNEKKKQLVEIQKLMEQYPTLLTPQLEYGAQVLNGAKLSNKYQNGLYEVTSRLDKLLQKYKIYPEIYYLYGKGNKALNKILIANENFEKALQLNQGYANAAYENALILMENGDLYSAEKIVEDSLKLQKGEIKLLLLLAQIYRIQGNYIDAIRSLNEVNRFRPNLSHPYIELAEIYYEINNLEAARVSLERAIQLEPNNIKALKLLLNVLRDPLLIVEQKNQEDFKKHEQEIQEKLLELVPEKMNRQNQL